MAVDKSEQRMIDECRRGNPDAWDELFDRHYAAAARYIFQLAPDMQRSDVEEICQEAFVSVIRNLAKFNGACQLQTWIFKIAGNKARDYREKQKAAKRGGGQRAMSLDDPDPQTGLKIDPAGEVRTPDQAMMTMENAALIGYALEELQENCREVIDLRYFGDCSYKEISTLLNLNEKTVSSRLSKCLDKLEEIVKMKFSGENFPVSPSNYH